MIPNEILNASDLSLRAKGLICWMLSKPDDWVFFKKNIYDTMEEGKEAINKAWSELVKAGYIHSAPVRGEKGKMSGYYHRLYDYRVPGNPSVGKNDRVHGKPEVGKPAAGLPEAENPPLLNTNNSNTEKQRISIPNGIDAAANGSKGQEENIPPGCDPPPANFDDKGEKGQEPQPKTKSKNGSKKGHSGIYPKFIDIYHIWFKSSHDGIPPKIDGAAGKAAKSIITYLKSIAKNQAAELPTTDEEREEAALNAWSYILNNWHRVEMFYQQKTRLIDINSNLQNILTQLKNGKPQQKRATNETTAADVKTAFTNIDNYFANRQS